MDHTGFLPSPTKGMGRAARSRLMDSSSWTLHFSSAGPVEVALGPVAGVPVIAAATGGGFFRLTPPTTAEQGLHESPRTTGVQCVQWVQWMVCRLPIH